MIYAVEKTFLYNPITSNLFATFCKISDSFYAPFFICGEQAYIVCPLKMQYVYESYLNKVLQDIGRGIFQGTILQFSSMN